MIFGIIYFVVSVRVSWGELDVEFEPELASKKRSVSITSASSDSELILASLANDQLPPVGVSSPSAVWKSPKSPKFSKEASSTSAGLLFIDVNGSLSLVLTAAESVNGPKPSSFAK